ncbi:MAG: PAS domain-containing protein [Myxococcales bacterium]|nr:PAS domain-containing protein [Myxococcales bacterium]
MQKIDELRDGSLGEFRDLLDDMLEGFQVLDDDWRYLYVNAAAAAHGRTTPEALLGRRITEAYPGIEKTEVFAALRRCMKDGRPARILNQFTYPEGGQAWFELHVQRIPRGIRILSMDVTAREHLSQVLRGVLDANQLMARERDPVALLRGTCDLMVGARKLDAFAVMTRGPDGRWSLTSAAGASSLDDFVVDGEVVPPPCVRRAVLDPEVVVEAEKDVSCAECPARASCAAVSDAHCVAFRIGDCGLGALVACHPRGAMSDAQRELSVEMARDLSFALTDIETEADRQRRARELAESERQMRTLLSNLLGMAYRYTLAPDWVIDFASEGAAELTGTPGVALEGTDLRALIHPEDRARVEREVREAIDAGRPFHVEYRLVDASGAEKMVSERGRAHFTEDGACIAEGLVIDVSAQHEARRQAEGAQRLESIGRLAGGLAHDFNNMLSVITTYVDLIRLDRLDDTQLLGDLEEVRGATARAEALTRQLLAFSRRQNLSPEVLDPNHVVEELAGLLRALLGEDVELGITLAPGPCTVRADRAQLEQILMNLAVNARDAMPRGG